MSLGRTNGAFIKPDPRLIGVGHGSAGSAVERYVLPQVNDQSGWRWAIEFRCGANSGFVSEGGDDDGDDDEKWPARDV